MRRTLARCAALGVALLLASSVKGDPPPPAPPADAALAGSYTTEELAALDRALHAVNCDRGDLRFQKDMAKGTGCLPLVRRLLADPLEIAPAMDALAAALDVRVAGEPTYGMRCGAELLREGGAHVPDFVRVVGEAENADARLASERSEAAPATPEGASAALALIQARWTALQGLLAPPAPGVADAVRQAFLESRLPSDMAMHPVQGLSLDAATRALVDSYAAGRPADELLRAAVELDLAPRLEAWRSLLALVRAARAWPAEAFATGQALVADSPLGRIAIGTSGDDVYVGHFAVVIDPGGNDRYVAGRFGAAVTTGAAGLVLDLGGEDVYDCAGVDVTLGAALFGVAALFDLGQGNDRYAGGNVSLGAAVGGLALLYDDGGSDVYEGRAFTQGAAAYGVGVLYDDAVQAAPVTKTDEETKDPVPLAAFDNDRLSAWTAAQAFARCRGVALCINTRGNETYEAGGVYLHAPLFADRYQSFSQGFAIGAREHDAAGGLALLVDRAGNDRYLGDIYDQGVGYWYAAGFLWDGGGNDLYEMTQYGQGSGIHLAVGGLIDVAGSDAYLMHSGLGQGGSHDFAASVLMDRGGNDRYHGNTSCNGCGLTNSVGLFFDRGGDDTYASRRDGGFNAGRPARGFGSLGVFVDLGGKDDYLGPVAAPGPSDGALWRASDVGVGIDTLDGPAAAAAGTSEPNQVTGKAEIPAVCRYEGELNPRVFDELWALSVRWEVGDNRVIVPLARQRLVAFGKGIVPLLDGKMERDESGLELRAYVDVLKGLSEAGAHDDVLGLLQRNLASGIERRRRVALHLVGELKVHALVSGVVTLLSGADEALARRAAGVLALLGSRAGDAVLLDWLASAEDERRILAALGTLLGSGAPVYERVRGLLAFPRFSVRSRLSTLLADQRAIYGAQVLSDLGSTDLVERARRTLLDVVARGPIQPDEKAVAAVRALLGHADWGVRADAARALALWAALPSLADPLRASAREALAALLEVEADGFVRRCAGVR